MTNEKISQQQVSQQQNEGQHEARRTRAATEAEAQSIDGKAGRSGKSSHDHMGHVKAGTHEGAGGGAKSKRHH